MIAWHGTGIIANRMPGRGREGGREGGEGACIANIIANQITWFAEGGQGRLPTCIV